MEYQGTLCFWKICLYACENGVFLLHCLNYEAQEWLQSKLLKAAELSP
uniref:Uncharacterized protein n=1 Tax=Rhizophora mucronata TaxID=61149 RepID=A0A2P2NHB8_RHIMU